MAIAITVERVALLSAGNKTGGIGTLTVDGDNSTAYSDNGLAMPSGWQAELGCPSEVEYVAPVLLTTATPGVFYVGVVDIANDKLVLMGGSGGSGQAFAEFAGTPADANYVGKILAMGY